jgi:FkbM family methyltransferase
MKENDRPYYWREMNFFRAFKECGFEPKAVFDVGSSHAGWSWKIAEVFPEAAFHLFEPLVDYKPFYQEGTAGALAQLPNVRIHKIALGARNGRTSFGSDEAGYSASTLVTTVSNHFPEMYEVPIRRLDSYVSEFGLARPEVLKIDVQGGEIAVLEGAGSLLADVRLIQIEAWLRRSYGGKTPLLHEITEYLSAQGFSLVDFGGMHYTDLHEVIALDEYFAHADLLKQGQGKLPKSSLLEDRI